MLRAVAPKVSALPFSLELPNCFDLRFDPAHPQQVAGESIAAIRPAAAKISSSVSFGPP
jgi:hypothetical protein